MKKPYLNTLTPTASGQAFTMLRKLPLAIAFILLVSCTGGAKRNETITRSFYYWKSSFALGDEGKKMLDNLHVKKVYVKFFDVDMFGDNYLPKSTLRVQDSLPQGIEVVPVIFITNATLLQTSDDYKVSELGNKISQKIKGMQNCFTNIAGFKEIQVDCDWSNESKDKYFALLENIKGNFPDVAISATIRLHQVKYFNETGVPPVSRGTLMFYNMGRIDDINGENSIFNEKDASRYLVNFDKYPLHLDIALPVFAWAVAYRDGKIFALVNDYGVEFRKDPSLEKVKDNLYKVTKALRYRDLLFMPGDNVKFEEVGPEEALTAASLIRPLLAKDSITVTLFDFDYNNLKQYETSAIEKVYSRFD